MTELDETTEGVTAGTTTGTTAGASTAHRHTRGGHDDGFDVTSLTAGGTGKTIHRDYAAHYFRWGWAAGAHGPGLAGRTVLDIGCGTDLPLLHFARAASFLPARYVGVDLNRLRELSPGVAKRYTLYGQTNFLARAGEILAAHGPFERVISFESIEHMPPEDGWRLLWWMREATAPDGLALLSTPVLGGRQAANHVHEYTVPELRHLVERAGFEVVRRFGTFMNAPAVLPAMRVWCEANGRDFATVEAVWHGLNEFHSYEVLSTFLAPLLPDAARNNAWLLRPVAV